jgi:hypothetical protein
MDYVWNADNNSTIKEHQRGLHERIEQSPEGHRLRPIDSAHGWEEEQRGREFGWPKDPDFEHTLLRLAPAAQALSQVIANIQRDLDTTKTPALDVEREDLLRRANGRKTHRRRSLHRLSQ